MLIFLKISYKNVFWEKQKLSRISEIKWHPCLESLGWAIQIAHINQLLTDAHHYLYSIFRNHFRTFLSNRVKFRSLLSVTFVSNGKWKDICTKFQNFIYVFPEIMFSNMVITIPKKPLVRFLLLRLYSKNKFIIIAETRIKSLC